MKRRLKPSVAGHPRDPDALPRHRQRHAAELVTLHQVAGDRRVRGLTARRAALRPAATISRSELSPLPAMAQGGVVRARVS